MAIGIIIALITLSGQTYDAEGHRVFKWPLMLAAWSVFIVLMVTAPLYFYTIDRPYSWCESCHWVECQLHSTSLNAQALQHHSAPQITRTSESTQLVSSHLMASALMCCYAVVLCWEGIETNNWHCTPPDVPAICFQEPLGSYDVNDKQLTLGWC